MDQAIAVSGCEDQCYGSGAELHTERDSNVRRKEERAGSIWLKTDELPEPAWVSFCCSEFYHGLSRQAIYDAKPADEGREPGQHAGSRAGWLCSSE